MRPSLQNSACLGQHQGDLPIFMGTWQKSDAPALQAGLSGSVTRRSPIFDGENREWKMENSRRANAIFFCPSSIFALSALRETRPMHREKPHKLLEVGVTPTPATSLRSKPGKSGAAAPEYPVRRPASPSIRELRLGRPFTSEVIRLPVCKTGVCKRAGRDDWSVTSTSRHSDS